MSLELDKAEYRNSVEIIDKPFDAIMQASEELRKLSYSELDAYDIKTNTTLSNIIKTEDSKISTEQDKKLLKTTMSIKLLIAIVIIALLLGFTPQVLSDIFAGALDLNLLALTGIMLGFILCLVIIHKTLKGYKVGLSHIDEGYKAYYVEGCSIDQFQQEIEYQNYMLTVLSSDIELSEGFYVLTRFNHRMLVINKCDC